MNTAELWYCPHCGKRQEGGLRRDVITVWEGIAPRHYRLCLKCMNELHEWLEGETE